MNLHKRLLLLDHLDKFIREQYLLDQTTEDIIAKIRYKSKKYQEKEHSPETFGTKKIYLTNYVFILNKRIIDFEHFRNKGSLTNFTDYQVFGLINFRDRIIFKKIYKD
jgi:hypothetical protein